MTGSKQFITTPRNSTSSLIGVITTFVASCVQCVSSCCIVFTFVMKKSENCCAISEEHVCTDILAIFSFPIRCFVMSNSCFASGDLARIVRIFRFDQHSVVCDTLRPVHLSVDFEPRTQPQTFSRSSAPFLVTKLVGVPWGVRAQSNGLGAQWGKVIHYFEQTAIVGSSHVTGWCIVVKITRPRSNFLFENRQ